MARREYGLVAMVILGLLATSAEGVGTLRLCGRELADALSLVCQARGGYNHAFAGGGKGGRYKRGIVDECCRGGCSLSTLESYCSGSEPRSNRKDTLQISKRSELSSSEIISDKQQDGRPPSNLIIATKNRRLRPLALIYSQHQPTENLNINYIKSRKKLLKGKRDKSMRETEEPIWSGYSEDNEPLDTAEIMAEVVTSDVQPVHPKLKIKKKAI